MTGQAAIGHVQSQCQGWIAAEKRGERKKDGRKERRKEKERQGGGRRKETVNTHTHTKLELEEGDVGVKEEIYGGRLLHSAAPGKRRKRGGERERGKTFPFPFLSSCHTGATQGVESSAPPPSPPPEEGWRWGRGPSLHQVEAWIYSVGTEKCK